jgi:YidC/Oxa1 family membrane protein insertase
MNYDNKNFILAIVLSMLIIFGWQYFYAAPLQKKLAGSKAHPQAVADITQQLAVLLPRGFVSGTDPARLPHRRDRGRTGAARAQPWPPLARGAFSWQTRKRAQPCAKALGQARRSTFFRAIWRAIPI